MSWIWNVILSFSDEEYWEEGAEDALESCPALDNINVIEFTDAPNKAE